MLKNRLTLSVEKNALVDKGNGVVSFPSGLTITDNSEQWNGTKYDIESMDISNFKGQLTANHSDQIQEVIGQVTGLQKFKNKVIIRGIKLAIEENALARFAYNMILGGWLTDFSIETVGPWPDDDGIFFNSQLVGLSLVVMGNNKSATLGNTQVQQIFANSVSECKKRGIDLASIQEFYKNTLDKNENIDNNDIMFVTIKNTRTFPVTLKYKNANGDEVTTEVKPGESIDVSSDQGDQVKGQVDGAKEPVAPAQPAQPENPQPAPAAQPDEDKEKAVSSIIKEALSPILKKVQEMEQHMFDNGAKEPSFKKTNNETFAISNKVSGELSGIDYRERHGIQILNAWDFLKGKSTEAGKKLETINKYHMEELKKKNLVSNAVTLGDFGNFVISPELLTDIQGFRSDYQPLVSKLNYQETLSLQMAWLNRTGDVNMQEVETCDDGEDGNLKPLSDYEATIRTSNLKEVAAVTPVCDAATRFLAADLLGDIAAGYRTDYDRKRAQLFIARLQQAVDANGNSVTYGTTSDTNALKAWISTWVKAQQEIMNGVFIFNQATYGELLMRAIGAGINGPLAGLFTTGDQPLIAGAPYIVVPNDLLPTLNTAQSKTFVVEGQNVTINKAVFYTKLSNFKGRTSGGLKYDLSTEAAYEDGDQVKSAYQRNELVIRGSFFRGGAVLDQSQVAALGAPGVS